MTTSRELELAIKLAMECAEFGLIYGPDNQPDDEYNQVEWLAYFFAKALTAYRAEVEKKAYAEASLPGKAEPTFTLSEVNELVEAYRKVVIGRHYDSHHGTDDFEDCQHVRCIEARATLAKFDADSRRRG